MIGIKSGSHLTRDEIDRKCDVGFESKYQIQHEGTGIDQARYAKNYQNAMGKCIGCSNFRKSKANTVTGEHCKAKFCERR